MRPSGMGDVAAATATGNGFVCRRNILDVAARQNPLAAESRQATLDISFESERSPQGPEQS